MLAKLMPRPHAPALQGLDFSRGIPREDVLFQQVSGIR